MSEYRVGKRVEILINENSTEARWVPGTVISVARDPDQHRTHLGRLIRVEQDPVEGSGAQPTSVDRYENAGRIRLMHVAEPAKVVQPRVSLINALFNPDLFINRAAGAIQPNPTKEDILSVGNEAVQKLDSELIPTKKEGMRELIRELRASVATAKQAVENRDDLLRHKNRELYNLTRQLSSSFSSRMASARNTEALRQDLNAARHQLGSLAFQDHKFGIDRGYILWCPTSKLPPQVRYATLAVAEKVQGIMAARYPGQVFHVLAIGKGAQQVTKSVKETITRNVTEVVKV